MPLQDANPTPSFGGFGLKHAGISVQSGNLNLGEFLERWSKDFASTNVRARTREGYRDIVFGHLILCLGCILLPRLKVLEFKDTMPMP